MLLKRIDVSRVQQHVPETEPAANALSPDASVPEPVLDFNRVPLEDAEPLFNLADLTMVDDDDYIRCHDEADRTFCGVACKNANRRVAYESTFSSWTSVLACCQSGQWHGGLGSATEPLLDPDNVIDPARQEAERTRKLAEHARKVRALNEKIMEAINEEDKEGIIRIYETEDIDLLWEAYQDLFEWLSKEEMDSFEEQWEDVVPDEDFRDLMGRRSALKVLVVKMTSFRMKKAVFG
eukprot:gnl/MRDRNA2_/MRDRNA2_26989_c0_seq1.p1 gnl/MRDRNA2_/MRDRNA2_26989_c0~~gnl/MRDRNA2_/MRDRNA2_26989_c0_seq1.p1  ORF type:complete len:237 (+),score=58.73 gnl/MRDRNA2_/MRDRNA2_26989_c0_seq1:1-711(+)